MKKRSVVSAWVVIVFSLVGATLPVSMQAGDDAHSSNSGVTIAAMASKEPRAGDTEAERNQATESILDSLRLDFAFGDGRPFREVLGELTNQSGLQFVIDQTAEDNDLVREKEISFSVESIRMRTGLEMMLKKYDGTFVIRDGVVVIISIDAASDPAFFRRKTFDVENLLRLIIRGQELRDQVYLDPVGYAPPGFEPRLRGIVCGPYIPDEAPVGQIVPDLAGEETAKEKTVDPAVQQAVTAKETAGEKPVVPTPENGSIGQMGIPKRKVCS